ncbi:MAG: M48 family metalloprotease [Campylobacterales bacterium]|nr:M48 family metalloprotease [Campylobacterales bacterium]
MKIANKSFLFLSTIFIFGGCANGTLDLPNSLTIDGKPQFIGVDHTCKEMYESYDANLESAMGIGIILASKKIESFTNKLSGTTTKSTIKESEIKTLARDVAKKSFWIPLNFEKLYGESLIEERLKDGRLINKNTKNKKYIGMYKKLDDFKKKYIAHAIAENAQFPFDVDIYISTEKDTAEAIPYGKVIISENYVANGRYKTILAHELSHVAKRHTTKEMQYRIVSVADSVTDILGIVKNIQSEDAGQFNQFFNAINVKGKFEKYSQDMELEADACGVRLLGKLYPENKAKHIDEMILNIDRTLQEEDTQNNHYTIQEHPDKNIRIENIKEVAKLI